MLIINYEPIKVKPQKQTFVAVGLALTRPAKQVLRNIITSKLFSEFLA